MVVLNENEFEELMDEITHRFSKANIDGTLKALLEKLGWNALLASDAEPLFTFENGKILVIGEQTVGIDMLRMTAKKAGFGLDRFEFMLDYEKAQTFVYSKLAYSPTDRVVMVGATPHSTTGTGQSGSLLAELENHPDKYPRTIALRTEEGTLKITKSGFRKALEKLKEENYIAA